MTKMSAAALLCFGLLAGLTAGNVTPPTEMAPSSGQNVLEELQEMKGQLEELYEMKQQLEVVQSGMVCGSKLELVTVKRVLALEMKLDATEAKLDATEAKLETTNTDLQSVRDRKVGSTFVRWGRKTCGSSTTLVYSGVAGGSHFTHTGAAANLLCLTLDPQMGRTNTHTSYGKLYGAEYELYGRHHDHDVPCSVCRAPLPTTIMLPGTQACPKDWTTQYTGYLTAGYWKHTAASQYVCLDKDMENDHSGVQDQNGYLFYYTHAVCGSLRCPPYKNQQIVLCAVCSK